MLTEPILLPKMGLTMEEGTVDEWLVTVGDVVTRGEAVAVISTYKAQTDVESPADGVLLAAVDAGETCVAGAVIGVVGERDQDPSAYRLRQPLPVDSKTLPEPPAKLIASVTTPEPVDPPPPAAAGAPSASPAARRRANELGLNLSDVAPSGPGGRIRVEDVERAAS